MADPFEHELLCKLAYQSWLQRGCPHGSPEVDWEHAKRSLGTHPPESMPNPPVPNDLKQTEIRAARARP